MSTSVAWATLAWRRKVHNKWRASVSAKRWSASRELGAREAAKKRLAEAEARLRRFQTAIEAGVDPAALVETINEAQAQRAAAKAELENTPTPTALTDAAVYAMIDSLGDVGAALSDARPENLSRLYRDLRLELSIRTTGACRQSDGIAPCG